MLKALFAALLLSGCATKRIQFEPTNSSCMDALIANFSYAKCKEIVTEGSWGSQVRVYCAKPEIYNAWTTREYYIVTKQLGGTAPDDAKLLCIDEGLFLLYKDGITY